MFLGPGKGPGRQGRNNPFKMTGAGIGINRLFTSTLKRSRYANQALGDTPPRDGPWAQPAAIVAKAMPPRTRERVRSTTGASINPFK